MTRYVVSIKVSKRIKLIRRKKKFTQEEGTGKARIHVSTLGRIERGESNPALKTLDKIAHALRVRPR